MCRLAAFPPGFEREHAVRLLQRFARGNGDGTGSVHIKDGKFVVNKWPQPLSRVVNKTLLSHMPHDSWTVVHLRAASHGGNFMENTHPFIKNKWAVAHNGIWSEYELVKAALKKYVTFEGETDSEVAAHLIATLGPKRFGNLVDFGGVFLNLNLNGELWVVKTSGELEMRYTKYGYLLASTLPEHFKADDLSDGWLRFDPKGELLEQKEYKQKWTKSQSCFIPAGVDLSETLEASDEDKSEPRFSSGAVRRHVW